MSALSKIASLASLPGNNQCADCRSPDVTFASYNIGVFLCTDCVCVHRLMGTHVSRTRSIKHDRWADEEVQFMEDTGNLRITAEYEQRLPHCYRRPDGPHPKVLLEQFIRAKYERREFIEPDQQYAYTEPNKVGHLFKRGRDSARFEIRRFELNEAANTLSYYVKEGKGAKLAMQLQSLNLAFVPEKIKHPNGLQLTYVGDGQVRHLFVYHHDGQTLVDWYMAVRYAKLNRLMVAFPGSSVQELLLRLPRDFTLEGWIHKVGPRVGDQYRRRWFSLLDRQLMYHDGPLDPVPKGVVSVGSRCDGFNVKVGVPPGSKDQGFSFTLNTRERTYLLSAATEPERAAWMSALRRLLDEPTFSQERLPEDKERTT